MYSFKTPVTSTNEIKKTTQRKIITFNSSPKTTFLQIFKEFLKSTLRCFETNKKYIDSAYRLELHVQRIFRTYSVHEHVTGECSPSSTYVEVAVCRQLPTLGFWKLLSSHYIQKTAEHNQELKAMMETRNYKSQLFVTLYDKNIDEENNSKKLAP